MRAAASLDQRSPFSAVAADGIAHHAAGRNVLGEPRKVRRRALGLEQLRLIDARNVVGRVLLWMHQRRRRMQQICRFDLAGMEAVGPLLLAHTIKCRARRAEEREGAQSELRAQIARQHIHQRRVAAMRVVEDQLS